MVSIGLREQKIMGAIASGAGALSVLTYTKGWFADKVLSIGISGHPFFSLSTLVAAGLGWTAYMLYKNRI